MSEAPSWPAGIERWFLRAGLFVLPLAFWWGTYDQYVLPKLLVARVLVIGLLILFISRAIASGTVAIKRTPLDLPLIAFVASAIVSTVFAYNRNIAIFGTYSRYDGVLTIATYAALFWLTVQSLARTSEARTLLRVLLASGYVVAAIAVVQSVSDSAAQGTVVSAFGTLGQKNVLGAFLVMLAPVAYGELIEATSWGARVVAANVLGVMGVALLLTMSRSAWLGAALAALVLVAGNRQSRVRLAVIGAGVLLAAGLVLASVSLASGLKLERSITAQAMTVFDPNTWNGRPVVWRDSLNLVASRPLLGYGPDNFGLVYPRFQTTNHALLQLDKAHAESLQIAATQGLVGLAAYLLIIAAFVRAFYRGRRNKESIAIFAGWVGYQVTLQPNFSTLPASLPFWIFAAAALELWGATRPTRTMSLAHRRVRMAVATPVIVALALLGVAGTVLPFLADSRLLAAVKADTAGQGYAARTAAAQARALMPQESVYAVEIGNIAFERGNWGSAAAAYRDAARLGTYNPLVFRNLGLAERNLGHTAEARAAARQAVGLDRFDPANRALLAEFESPAP